MKCNFVAPLKNEVNVTVKKVLHGSVSCGIKGRFPLDEMTCNFARKDIWACALTFFYSLSGKRFLFKILKMSLTNSRRKKSQQLLDQSKHMFLALPPDSFTSDRDANDLRNIHVPVDVFSALLPLKQGNLYVLQKKTFLIKVLNLDFYFYFYIKLLFLKKQ